MQNLYEIAFLPSVERYPPFENFDVIPGKRYYSLPTDLDDPLSGGTLLGQENAFGKKLISIVSQSPIELPNAWRGEDLNGKKVGYYHIGSLGDELVHTAIYRELRVRYPSSDLHVFTRSDRLWLLVRNPDIGYCPRKAPIAWSEDLLRSMDYWIFPKQVGWQNRYVNDEGIYSLIAQEIGINTVSIERPYIYIADDEREIVWEFLRSLPVPPRAMELLLAGRCIYIQMDSNEECRTPIEWEKRLFSLRQAFSDYLFVIVAREATFMSMVNIPPGAIWNILGKGCFYYDHTMDRFAASRENLTPKSAAVLMERSRLCITPDSFAVHLAAAYDIPTIALWRMEDQKQHLIPSPESRISAYPNARAVDMRIPNEDLVALLMAAL